MLLITRRLCHLVWSVFTHGVKHAASLLVGRRTPSPQRVRLLLEQAGGTFLKFGQVLALQPDIIPRRYCNALFDLMDRVPPFSYAQVEQVFISDLGKHPSEIFDEFSHVPIASASIGQVHTARKGHLELAVKVQRPDISRTFGADLKILTAIAGLIRRLGLKRLTWLERAVHEFATWTHEELDYRYEARFMAALAYHAQDRASESVPAVFLEHSSARILVAELLDGPMVLEHIRSLERGRTHRLPSLPADFDPETYARHIVDNFVSDAFHNGLFHADLHPANLLILPDNVVGYVDFGITGSLSAYSRRNLIALTLALSRGEVDEMYFYLMRICTTDEHSDLGEFRRRLDELVKAWFAEETVERHLRVNFTRIMLDMIRVARETGVIPTQDMIRYIRSVVTADGLITRFAPEMDVNAYLQQICEDYLQQELWEQWLSLENLADWTLAGATLLSVSPERLSMALRDTSPPHTSQQLPGGEGDRDEATSRVPTLVLGLLALGTCLATLAEEPLLGLNLFTAELAMSVTAATMVLVKTLRE